MGLDKKNTKHKQKNFFLYFPMYFCLGVFYILKLIFYPIIKLVNPDKTNINRDPKALKREEGDLRGAFLGLTEEEAKLIERENVKKKQEVRINDSLIKSRESLINEIDAEKEARSSKPITYKYTALSPSGKVVTNTFPAFSKVEVYSFLENEGYKVFKIETNAWIERFYGPSRFKSRKIKTKHIVFWLQQLSTYLKAGIPLTESMRILSKQMGANANIKRTFDNVVYYLTLGESFSTALEKQGDAFPSLLINMIKSAEATGDLEGTLDEMADYYSATETTRKEMISALTYPTLVMLFSIGVVVFILVYLIPQFVGIYATAGAKLNPITSFIIAMSDYLKSNLLYIIIILIVVGVVIYILYNNIKVFKYTLQTIAMKIPVFGKLIMYKEMMIFTKTFSSLLKNNVFITDSMNILGKVTSNEIYRGIMIRTLNFISKGEKISEAFKGHWAIPDVAYYMMVTGESTGQLAEMMGKVSNYYAEQHKVLINSMKSLIEPILIVFLAVVVGGIIIAVIVPMFSLYSQIMI